MYATIDDQLATTLFALPVHLEGSTVTAVEPHVDQIECYKKPHCDSLAGAQMDVKAADGNANLTAPPGVALSLMGCGSRRCK